MALKYLTKTILYKRKYKIWRRSQFIEDFILFIKQCYHVVWSAGKIQKLKIQKLEEKKTGKNNALSKCEVCDKIKIYQRATS